MPNNSVHIRCRIKGNGKKIETFQKLMRILDSDWPYREVGYQFRETMKFRQCEKCQGMVWFNPVMTKEDIKAAARQMQVGMKIYAFTDEQWCSEQKTKGWVDQLFGHVKV